jgi:16S rRNA C1402 N4-methylase RsmH
MLTFEDCLALCNLSEEEILAIAEHEHIPEITAIEYGQYLIQTTDGELRIKRMIVEDIEHSRATGNIKHAEDLEKVLKHFVLNHPKLQSRIKARAH